jgi:hypothetical protein
MIAFKPKRSEEGEAKAKAKFESLALRNLSLLIAG